MYIKKVKKLNGRTKKVYEYLHLVESVRTENGPRQRLILNLGNIDIDPFQYNALAKRIESILTGQRNLFEPASELHTKTWVENRSALYELTGLPLRRSLNSYYRAGDKLYSLKDALENHLSSRERDIFSLSEKMFFFDLTNTYFEGEALRNPKAKRGRSKEKRSDCKLVILGLIIDETGLFFKVK